VPIIEGAAGMQHLPHVAVGIGAARLPRCTVDWDTS
jgi:hypothetical protein